MHEAARKRMVSRSPSSYKNGFMRALARATEDKLKRLEEEDESLTYHPAKRARACPKKKSVDLQRISRDELKNRPQKRLPNNSKMRIDLPPSRAMKILEKCKEKKSTPPKSAGDLFRDALWSNSMDVSPSATRSTPRAQNAFDSYRQNARPSFDVTAMQHSTPVSSRPPSRSSSEKSRHDKPYARVSPKSPCKKSLDYGKFRPNSRLIGDLYDEPNKENFVIEPDLEGKLMGYGATLTKIAPKPIEEVDLETEELVAMLGNDEDWSKPDAFYSVDDAVDAFVPDDDDDDTTPAMFRQSNFYEVAQQYDAKIEPHLMGLPNSLNDCWLNSSVQCLLSLEPFVHDLESFVLHFKERTNLSQVVRSFVVLNRHRREGSRLKVNEAIRKFQKSLHAIRKEFSGSNQQDVSEFLVCFFDFLCDESKRLSAGSLTNSTLRELSLNNNRGEPEKCDEGETGPSPVGTNFTLTIVRNKACSGCSYVGVEREKVQTIEVSPNNATSLQAALNQSLKSETVERACECGAREGVTSSQIEVLPRFLVLHVNRYLVSNSDKGSPVTRKLTNPLRIPKYLSTDVVTTDEPRIPVLWTPDMTNGEDAVNDQYDSLLSVDTPTKSSKVADDIDEEEEVLQQVLLASRRDAELAALDDSSHDTPTIGGQEAVQECDGSSANCYQLTSVISHIGSSSNQGHYVADVYDYTKQSWFRYDDMQVTPQDYAEVVNKQQQKNGYIFVYVHKAQLAQLVHNNDQTPKKNYPFAAVWRKLAQVDVD